MSARLEGWMAASEGRTRDPAQPAEWLEGFDGYAAGMAAEKARQERVAADRAAYLSSPEYLSAARRANAKARARKRFSGTPRSLDGTGGRF